MDSLPKTVVWIPVETFHAADYALDPHLIDQLAGRPVGDGLACTHLSIHALWFATVWASLPSIRGAMWRTKSG